VISGSNPNFDSSIFIFFMMSASALEQVSMSVKLRSVNIFDSQQPIAAPVQQHAMSRAADEAGAINDVSVRPFFRFF
jgi:hypothetical protein